jgi:hypothetical protein
MVGKCRKGAHKGLACRLFLTVISAEGHRSRRFDLLQANTSEMRKLWQIYGGVMTAGSRKITGARSGQGDRKRHSLRGRESFRLAVVLFSASVISAMSTPYRLLLVHRR